MPDNDLHDTGIAPQCWTCLHLIPLESGYGWRCAAYPNAIPKEIMVNMVDHREAYRGDNGVRWEPRVDLLSPERIDAAPPIRRAAGVLFLTKGNQILLLRRRDDGPCDFPGTWSLPGGLAEGDESAAETAAREAEEETGRKVDPVELTEWTRQVARGADFTTFVCSVDEPFDVTLCHEHDASDWVDLKDLIGSESAIA